ncbi:TPA: hypothetical protein ACH3X2_011801 [Trebouxia sp. C0005]
MARLGQHYRDNSRHSTSGTMHVSMYDDRPLSPSDTATHQFESSNKAHSISKPDSVSAEDGGSTGASPIALLPDEQMATSPSFDELAPVGKDDSQHEHTQDSLTPSNMPCQAPRVTAASKFTAVSLRPRQLPMQRNTLH